MPAYTNFYETVKEAVMRLRGTIVLYDKLPYYVMAIAGHHKDGIYRVYLDPVGEESHAVPSVEDYGPEHPLLGGYIDQWLDAHKDSPVLRKQMNSPLFDKFRPFPLGMCNIGKQCYYLERQPLRPKTEQGLTRGMVNESLISLGPVDYIRGSKGGNLQLMSPSMKACITGDHPGAKECLENLLSGDYENEAVAFHREFAFVKGPIGMIFLAYKSDIVGVLPKNNFDFCRLGEGFKHCREAVGDLRLFTNIVI